MQPDKQLVTDCERIAGTHMHALRNCLHAYFGYCQLAQENPAYLPRAQEQEHRLRAYARLGDPQYLQPKSAQLEI